MEVNRWLESFLRDIPCFSRRPCAGTFQMHHLSGWMVSWDFGEGVILSATFWGCQVSPAVIFGRAFVMISSFLIHPINANEGSPRDQAPAWSRHCLGSSASPVRIRMARPQSIHADEAELRRQVRSQAGAWERGENLTSSSRRLLRRATHSSAYPAALAFSNKLSTVSPAKS